MAQLALAITVIVILMGNVVQCANTPPLASTKVRSPSPNSYSLGQEDVHSSSLMRLQTLGNLRDEIQHEKILQSEDPEERKDPAEHNEPFGEGLFIEEGFEGPFLMKDVEGFIPESLWMAFHSEEENDLLRKRKISPVDSVLGYLGGLYLPHKNFTTNPDCIADLDIIYNHTVEHRDYITMLVDSWGKFPDGFIAGNTHIFGSFDECLKIQFLRQDEDPSKGSFNGQYCTISYKEAESTKDEIPDLHMAPIINESVNALSYYFMYGSCIPASCTSDELKMSIDHHLHEKQLNLKVKSADCQLQEHPPLEYTAGAIVMIVVLAVEGALILGGGAVDMWITYTGKDDLRKGPLKYLLPFSIYTNLYKMFSINTSESKQVITCFYGLRVLSMFWVITGHQYMLTQSYSANRNLIVDLFNGDFAAQIILNAYPAVETFFFMSGFLVAYVFFKEQERSGKFNIFLYYFHRFIRLSPPIMLWCGFLATFEMQMVRGPMAYRGHSGMENCRKYWYRDAFFMSNFGGYGDDYKGKCLGVSWYTSVDSQLYLASPLFILPFIFKNFFDKKLFKGINVGVIWLFIVTVISCIIPGVVIGVNHLPPNPVQGAVNTGLHHKLVYYRPWCRASPYLVGMCLAYFIQTNKKEIKLKMWQAIAGWIVATGLGVSVVFGMYNYNQITDHKLEYQWAPSIFYGALHSLVWGLAVSWVVFACHYGYGGPINTFLSHPSFQPLSRITYCTFLIGLSIQGIIFNYNMVVPPYYSHLNKVIEIVGVAFIAGIGGILLSLYTEGPILGLEKLLLRK